ncbi:MAG: Crp/Fnr family transcriptional regulator [Candidatus Saccharimonas sp.]
MTVQSKIQDFFAHYPVRRYRKGDTIIQIDEIPPVFYVEAGGVLQCDISDSGDKLVVNIYKNGAFLPLGNILNNLSAEFFFEAMDDLTVRVAPSADVLAFLQANPDVTYDALVRMSRGSNGLLKRLAKMMGGDAESRIIQELEIMHARFDSRGKGVAITEAELASQTGLARETVSRTLKRLKERGLITSSRGRITLFT